MDTLDAIMWVLAHVGAAWVGAHLANMMDKRQPAQQQQRAEQREGR